MNMEATRWVLGIILALIFGAYGYTWVAVSASGMERAAMESRIERQLDLIERKVDRVLVQQWEAGQRGKP